MFDANKFDKLFGEQPNSQLNDEVMKEAAESTFKIFKTFVNAGFTEDQALTIILDLIQPKF